MTYKQVLVLSVLAAALMVLGCATVQSQWKTAVTTNTIDGYQDFAKQHAKTVYADSAQLAIERLNFKAADKQNTIAAYQAFLKQYPKSVLAVEANDRIDELQFKNAAAINTIAGYKSFIASNPGSPRVAAAQQGIGKLKADMVAKEPAAAQAVLVRYPASATKGEIPAKYVGNWVIREDGIASQYLIITSSYVIWKALAGADQGEQVFKPGSYEVGSKGLKLTARMAYSASAGAGDKSKMPVPLTITTDGKTVTVNAAQSEIKVKGKVADMHDLIVVQPTQVKDNVKLTRPPQTASFVKAGQ